MGAGFDQPLWLAAVPVAVGVVLLLGAPGRPGAGRSRRRPDQRRLALWARAAAVGLLALALAGPRVGVPGGGVDVAFVVDASDSVGPSGRAAALTWVQEALAARGRRDRAAVALFGRSPRLEHSLRADPPGGPPTVVVDGSASDLAAAARLGQGVLGSERRRRVVLLSDGRQTEGDLVAVAEQLGDAGVALDVVALPVTGAADVLVEEVRAPGRVRKGEAYTVVAVLRNTGDRPVDATVAVTADGQEVARRDVTVEPGRAEVPVEATAGAPGTVRYEARVSSGASTVEVNDVGRAAVRVDGPPKVLLVEGGPGRGDDLARALEAAAIPSERRDASGQALPSLDRLLDYDSVVLVDVPAATLGEQGMTTLDTYVRDAGRGLVAVAGEDSFGLGGYGGTPLEDLLPVFATVTDPKRRPSVAEALVVDTSGSMAACHCADEETFGAVPQDNLGVRKTDIAKEAVARAVAALESQDQVGVLAYSEGSDWVVPLQHLPPQAVIDEGLSRIHPVGGTNTAPAVRQAIRALRDVDARLRHIVLFTDGFEPNESGLVAVAEEAREAGITLSVVATGEGTMQTLERMAEAGGGRFYPGRDLFSIPDIIALEVQFAARPIVTEGTFLPVVTGRAPATAGLDAAPPLHGYLATTAKPTARTLLAIGEERDPLLATWQAGLGSASAWTSDASPRWSARWVSWERFAGFWSDVVRDTFPARDDARFALEAAATGDGVRLRMTLAESVPDGVDALASVTEPDGTTRQVRLDRVGLDAFETVVPATGQGVYAVTGRLRHGEDDLYVDAVTAIRSYSQEYAAGDADPTLLARAAEAAGGRVDPEPTAAFATEGLEPGQGAVALWPWLAALALALAVTDVGLRRLRLERDDWGRVLRWLRRRARRSRQRKVGERSAAAEGLLAAKARARGRARPPDDRSAEPSPPPPPSDGAVGSDDAPGQEPSPPEEPS